MSFRLLQFWGDLRAGLNPAWEARVRPSADALAGAWIHHQHTAAAALREAMGIPSRWDAKFSHEDAKWITLGDDEFQQWCEAVGLLSLGEHLKRIVSLKAMERMQVSLDRRTLAAVVQFANQHIQNSGNPLPLDVGSARELGERVIAVTCSRAFPQLWSRLRLRLNPDICERALAEPYKLVFLPNMQQLQALDGLLFDRKSHHTTLEDQPATDASWMQLQTLCA